MNFKEELRTLLKAKTSCVWVRTHEERRAIDIIAGLVAESFVGNSLFTYSLAEGLRKKPLIKIDKLENPTPMPPNAVFQKIMADKKAETKTNNMYLFKDLHSIMTNAQLIRSFRDALEMDKREVKNSIPMIIVSPIVDVPTELDKLITVIDFDTPDKEDIAKIFNAFQKKIAKGSSAGYKLTTDYEIEKCVELANGLTEEEIKNYIARSLISHNQISQDIFYNARIDLIKKTGILDYRTPKLSMDDMGGNHAFKEWIDDVRISYEDEASALFGVEKSKGYLALGVPGTAKTISAEMISSLLDLPLLKLEMSNVMGSLVGQSERNMAQAIKVVKACSPCVLLIDEIEKTLSGGGSGSGISDGGAMRRVFGQLIEFMASEDSKDVFTIMTSNDASQMPPELTRSGRLDTIWFFGLPTLEERKEIFKIHFGKMPIQPSEELLDFSAINSENFTGAEIKEAVKVAMRRAYKRYKTDGVKDITIEDIEGALLEIIKVYDSSREKIRGLEEYSRNRARFSNSQTTQINSIDEDDDLFKI